MNRKALSASLLALLCALFAGGAHAQCVPSTAISASIGLIDQPFPYEDLEPELTAAQIAALPGLPDLTETEIPRREHAYISSTLAASLGVTPHDSTGGDLTVNPDWERPNPQIRVRITNPATFSNWNEEAGELQARSSNAVFTVVGVIDDDRRIVWVYEGLIGSTVEDDSGQYKLFAEDTSDSDGDPVRQIHTFADANSDGLVDTVAAHVYCSPVSRSSRSLPNGATIYNHYTENDAFSGGFREHASKPGDNRFALLLPHAGDIEPGTGDQSTGIVSVLLGLHSIPVNQWKADGRWAGEQAFERWHITATGISEQSFPALKWMLDQTKYSGTFTFRRALALHGFDAENPDIIIGGRTSLNAKCHVATKIKAESGMGPVAVRIYHDEDLIDIPATGSRKVCREGLSGYSTRNIVNRVAAEGGIQIEQSEDVRETTTYRNGVTLGAAKAIADLLNGTAPTNACDVYDEPQHEDDVDSCDE